MKDRYRHFYKTATRKKHGKTNKAARKNTTGTARKETGRTGSKRTVLTKKQRVLARLTIGTLLIFVGIVVVGGLINFMKDVRKSRQEDEPKEQVVNVPELIGVADRFPDLPITEDFLSINEYSRPGLALSGNPQYIVIHYTANPGSTAKQNRDYFEGLKDSHKTYASAQFVIGLEGEIEQCVPCNEMAYCSNSLNDVCISIELCHPDEGGNFNDATYNNCVSLVARLMNYYHMDMDHLIRHYDVTGKNCPKYFVEHSDRWQVFKDYVEEYREKYRKEDKTLTSGED